MYKCDRLATRRGEHDTRLYNQGIWNDKDERAHTISADDNLKFKCNTPNIRLPRPTNTSKLQTANFDRRLTNFQRHTSYIHVPTARDTRQTPAYQIRTHNVTLRPCDVTLCEPHALQVTTQNRPVTTPPTQLLPDQCTRQTLTFQSSKL